MSKLILRDAMKRFNVGTVNEKVALNHLDFTLEDGDFVTVIGGNGAGKSTLLNIISGVYPLDSGSIELANTDVSRFPEHRRARFIGRVFQDPMMGTASEMSIEENLAMANKRGKQRGLGSGIHKGDRGRFIQSLKQLGLGLEGRLKDKAGLLSGGQRQALTLLMATIQRPDLLLLDEHTAALDPSTASKVLRLTEELIAEHHLSTLMVTHNMKDALSYGNRLIMLDKGHIIADIPQEVKETLQVRDLLYLFSQVSGGEMTSDRMLLI